MASLMDDDLKKMMFASSLSSGLQNLGSQLMALGSRGRIQAGTSAPAMNPLDVYKIQAMQAEIAQQQAQRDAWNQLFGTGGAATYAPGPAAMPAMPDLNTGGTGQTPASLTDTASLAAPTLAPAQPTSGLMAGFTPEQRLMLAAAGPDKGVPLLAQFTKPPEIREDAAGVPRYTTGANAGNPVFPGVGAPQYGEPKFDANVGKWYQTDPKTGKRNYTSVQTGMEVTLPDGTTVKTGVPQGGSVPGMSKTTGTRVEGEILKYGDVMSGLRAIRSRYRPEFQQLATRWETLQTAWKDKMGMDVDPADKALLADYTAYVAEAGQNFSETLKNLSGVAVNPEEMKRAERFAVNPGTPGLWGIITGDGDSPTQLEAKLQRQEEFVQRALMKYQYLQYNGFGVDDVDLDDMPKLMNEKGDKLFAEYSKTMPEADAMAKTKADLAAEFGIGVF